MSAALLPQGLPLRRGDMLVADLIDLYMQHYAGRDTTRAQRLRWWVGQVGAIRLDELSDDHVHASLEALALRPPSYYCGKDANGEPILKAKGLARRTTLAPGTINRYQQALAAVVTWSIKRRIAPKGLVHPCRSVERRPENNEKTRFLTADERDRLLTACKASKWPRLYVLVLLALSTGARRGELRGLRWQDVDFEQRVVHVGRSKNGDPKLLPLIPAAVEELQRFVGKPGELVFASRVLPSVPYGFEERFGQALKAARVRGVTFHTLRHSCASFLAQNGATLLEIGDLLGHRQIAMTRRYSHLAASHRTAQVNRVFGDLR